MARSPSVVLALGFVLLAVGSPARAQEPGGAAVELIEASTRGQETAADPVVADTAVRPSSPPDAGHAVTPEELAAIEEQLEGVRLQLAKSEQASQRTFFLVFLAIILLIVNIFVQRRRP